VVAALIVATVLTAVMMFGWSSVLNFEVERLDDRLCMEARRIAGPPLRPDRMASLEADMMLKLRLDSAEQLMLRFEPTDGGAGLQSSNWDSGVRVDALNWKPAGGTYAHGICSLASYAAHGSRWRAALFTDQGGRGFVAADLAATKAELQGAVRRALTIVIPLALALSALGAWLLSSLTMRPVNRLRDAMKGMSQTALDQRLPTRGEDLEFQELIGAYNTMLARLEASFRQASRFSSDAAHELRTPLTVLRGRIEQAVNKSNGLAIQSDLTDLLDEVSRLSDITRKLLLLSQADAGRLALNITRVDLAELLDDLVSDAQMLVAEQKLSGAVERNLVAECDEVLVRQLFNNLVSNAVSYSLPGGWIEVVGRRLPPGIEVTFANATHPIPAADRAHFFDRFYRGDPAHNRSVEGSGLGLSLAREIARAHGGDLTLEPSAPNEVRLRLWLPVAQAAQG